MKKEDSRDIQFRHLTMDNVRLSNEVARFKSHVDFLTEENRSIETETREECKAEIDYWKSVAEAANIIGHFGLGFYSSFMVSNKVALITKSFRQAEDEKGVIWECDGSPEYTMNEIPKGTRGTDVILYISDDCEDFLEESKIRELLNKYCKFLSVPIQYIQIGRAHV